MKDELGVPPIIRTSRPVRLIDTGRLFYRQSLQVPGRVGQMRTATRRIGLNQNSVFSTASGAQPLMNCHVPAVVGEHTQV